MKPPRAHVTRLMARAAHLLLHGCLLAGGLVSAADRPSPLSPDESLQAFQTEPGLEVQLVASEPDVLDPVAMAFDQRGRLFAVEARGYPTDLERGSIALLEDEDGDGRYTRRSTYATGLRFPTGLLPWKGGLFVTDAPELLFLEDTTGDGQADARRVVLRGFATDRSTQLRVNDPTLGLDGSIYLAGGLSGGSVRSPRHPDRPPVDLRRKDLRFDPSTEIPVAIDGKSQFGLSFDDFGRRFICMNRVQAQHVVISSRHLARNPNLAFSETVENLPEERIEDLLKGHNAAARIYPLSDNITTADSHAGTFSAACAVTVWRGDSLPARYLGQVFSCDPTGNLLHRDELVQHGATFRARRSRDERELVASPDNWFRPVFLATGPDGALYVCDMYRRVIEHPDYLPHEVRGRTDFQSGRDRGRIYRVVGAAAAARGPRQPVDESTEALVKDLQSPRSWRRDTAFRLLIERSDTKAAPRLQRVLHDARSPAGQVMAAHLLERLGRLESRDLLRLLLAASAGVREVGLELAAPRLGGEPALAWALRRLAEDPDPRVRFGCALALAETVPSRAREASLVEIARRGATDRWTRAAVISAAPGREAALLEQLLSEPPGPGATGLLTLVQELARASGRSCPRDDLREIAGRVLARPSGADDVWALALLIGWARAGAQPRALASGEQLADLAKRALRIATDVSAPDPARRLAIEFIGYAKPPSAAKILTTVLSTAREHDLRLAAARALGRTDEGPTELLAALDGWSTWPTAIREIALAQFISRAEFASGLLRRVEQGSIPATSLSVGTRKRLLGHGDAAVRKRAGQLFAAAESDRMKVFEAYRPILELQGDPGRGRAVFRELCAPCHRLEREGSHVGPDLFGVRNQTKETLLLHIIVPNHEIPSGFEATVVTTKTGETFTGSLTSETQASITIRQKGGVEETLLRSDVATSTVSPISLMPEGLETSTTPQGLADLLAYLRGEG